MQHTVARKRN